MNIIMPTYEDTFRYGKLNRFFNNTKSGNAKTQQLCGYITRGIGYRNLAGRLAAIGGGVSAKSYVQNGLFAMWDGIENAGYGNHDDDINYWIDLVSAFNAVKYTEGNIEWVSNGLVCDENHPVLKSILSQNLIDEWTVEVVITPSVSFFGNYHGVIGGCNRNSGNSLIMLQFEDGKLRIGNYGVPIDSTNCFAIGGFESKSTWPTSTSILSHGVATTISLDVNSNTNTATLLKNGLPYSSEYVNNNNCKITNRNIYIGVGDYSSGVTNRRFCGILHCARIYSKSLSSYEVAYNYAVDKARFNLP